MAVAVLLSYLALGASAVPQLTFPINSQVPPIARVSEQFIFQFSSSTFTSTVGSSLRYAIHNGPSWLQLDETDRTFSGTPSANDIGPFSFSLLATDSSGSTSALVTLIVVDSTGPQLGADISQQLATFGLLSSPTSLALFPSTNFNFTFSANTFKDASNLTYYAISEDRSPLPSWLDFNAKSLRFSGLTPPLITWPQTFGVKFIASDVIGFSGAAVDFALVISNHRLVFEPCEQNVYIKNGTEVSFDLLRSQLSLDGALLAPQAIQNANATVPSWMHFDPQTFEITGTAPSGTVWQNITVSASDQYGDVAIAEVNFNFRGQIFNGEIGVLNATIGKTFKYTINRSILVSPSDTVTVDFGAAASWLHFTPSTLEIYGTVPDSVKAGTIQASLTAQSPATGSSGTQLFEINVTSVIPIASLSQTTSFTPVQTSNTSPQTSSGTAGNTGSSSSSSTSRLSNGDIAGAVIGPVLALLVLILVAFCHMRQRPGNSGRRSSEERKLTIRGPIKQHTLIAQGGYETDLEKGDSASEDGLKDEAPRLDTSIPHIGQDLRPARYRKSGASFLAEGEATILESFAGSSMGYNGGAASRKLRNSVKHPLRGSRRSKGEKAAKHQSHRSSRQYRKSGGLPIGPRMSGRGHGRGSINSFGQGLGIWTYKQGRGHSSCDSSGTPSTGILYEPASPSYFPKPPSERKSRTSTSYNILEEDKRKSIRMVVNTDQADRRPLAEKRRSYIRNRASSTYNPFFAAGNSRTSSLSKRAAAVDLGRSGSLLSDSNSLGGPISGTRSYSQSSSVEPPIRNPKRLDSSAYREHMANLYPRVVKEHSDSDEHGCDPWETVDNTSNYDDDDDDDEYGFSDSGQDRKSSRSLGRPSRESRSQVLETGKISKARRPIPGTSRRVLVSNAAQPKLVDVTGKRPVSVEESNNVRVHLEQTAEVGQAEYGPWNELDSAGMHSSHDDEPAFL